MIFAQFKNITNEVVVIEEGTRIIQGVFNKFLTIDNDNAQGTRVGGLGSTGK